jgi:hypothetical protein
MALGPAQVFRLLHNEFASGLGLAAELTGQKLCAP